MASQIIRVFIVCWTVCSGADQRKHQSSASLAFVRGIHRWPVNSPHKRPVTRKLLIFDDVIMNCAIFNHIIMHGWYPAHCLTMVAICFQRWLWSTLVQFMVWWRRPLTHYTWNNADQILRRHMESTRGKWFIKWPREIPVSNFDNVI